MTRAGWAAVAGAALVGVVWLPTLGHRLLFVDDLAFTTAAVERLHAGALFAPRPYYRPVVELVLCGLWAASGTSAVTYRAVLLGLHVLSAGLVLGLGRVIGLSRSAAGCAAILFLLAPTHRETVMWTSGIIQVAGGAAALGCLLLVARGWLWGWRAGAVAFLFVAGLLAYPSLSLLPLLIHAAWGMWHRDRPWPMGLVAVTTVAVIGWGVVEYLIPLLNAGGRYPHLQDVSRQPFMSVAIAARNVLVGLTYAWSPGSVAEVLPPGVAPVVKALLVYAPDNVPRVILDDPRAELRLLDSVEPVPTAAVRPVILIESDGLRRRVADRS